MAQPLRIALAGLGTVGVGVIRLVEANKALIERRAGRPIVITVVSARDRSRARGVDLSPYAWEDDMVILGERQDVDVVVEMVGGDTTAKLTVLRTLHRGHPIVRPELGPVGDDRHDGPRSIR